MTILSAQDVSLRYTMQERRVTLAQRMEQILLRRRRRRHFFALRDVSFELEEGDVLGLIGNNGAGKSTLCRVLAGVLTPDRGRVEVRGTVAPLLAIGAGLERELSGRDNILLGATLMGLSSRRIEELTPSIIDFAELDEFIDHPIRTYSSGMRARLAFAIATSIDPDLLILDEVLGVGDACFKRKSRARIRELIEGARAVVLVSHSTRTLLRTCTKVLWLHQGECQEIGEPKRVLRKYERWVARRSERAAQPARDLASAPA